MPGLYAGAVLRQYPARRDDQHQRASRYSTAWHYLPADLDRVYEDTAWAPEGDTDARAYQPHIIPRWISQDGKSFWLAFTDYQIVDGERPYTCMNVQKAEILTD